MRMSGGTCYRYGVKFIVDFPSSHGLPLRRIFEQPLALIRADHPDQVRPALRQVAHAAERGLHAVGFVSYEAAPAFDRAAVVQPASGLPLLCFGLFEQPTATGPTAPGTYALSDWRIDTDAATFAARLGQIREAIRRGDSYQINYTLRLHAEFSGDDLFFYEQLRLAQGTGYCGYADIGRYRILSASPELFFDWRNGLLTTRPMKGTARRGNTAEEDAALARWLRESEKNRAENLMIVDLLRNDLSRLAVPGGVHVPSLFDIETYPTVMQMTSTITARTRPQIALEDVFAALFPCGSITGAPKLKSMALIAGLEDSPRGAYCGAFGHVEPGGAATFNVAIRTVTLDTASGRMECGVGAGITWDSEPSDEYREVLTKARFLAAPTEGFELLETLRLEQGRYTLLHRHLERLQASAAHFGFAPPGAAVDAALAEFALTHTQGCWRVRLGYARAGQIRLEAHPLSDDTDGERDVALALAPVSRTDLFLRHKTTRRALYEAHAAAASPGVFDVLLWNERGELTEFTRGNLVVEVQGRRLTPPLECGLLDGCLRRELLDSGVVEEHVLRCEHLIGADAVWFINSVRGWIRVKLPASATYAGPAAWPPDAEPSAERV